MFRPYPKPEPKPKKAPAKIKPRSKKRAKEERTYAVVRKVFLENNPNCRKCKGQATTVHHQKGRDGPLLTNVRYFIGLCMDCHTWVELNPLAAKAQGYSLPR